MARIIRRVCVVWMLIDSHHVWSFDINSEDTEIQRLPKVEVTAKRVNEEGPVTSYVAHIASATKTNVPLLNTPQAITVVTQAQIKDRSVQSVADALLYVPGVVSSQGEGNRDAVNFRGVGVVTGDFYLDGVRDDIQTYRDFYNIERVEVLKGSNGLIFGRGAAGGAINRVSKEAGFEPLTMVRASWGAYQHQRLSGDWNHVISNDMALRLNALSEDSGSYREGVVLRRYGISPNWLWILSDSTRLILSAEYFDDHHVGDRGIPSLRNNNSQLGNRPFALENNQSRFFGNAAQSFNDTITQGLGVFVEHRFDRGFMEGWTLKNRTRYTDYDKFYQNVFAANSVNVMGLVDIGAYNNKTDRQNFINQTDLTAQKEWFGFKHQWLMGLELGRQRTQSVRRNSSIGDTLGAVSALNPVWATPINFNNITNNIQSEVNLLGLYAQDQMTLSSHWQLILGGRYDRFDAQHHDVLTTRNFDVLDQFVSPRAGLLFKPQDNITFYGSYSVSYVPRAGDQLTNLNLVRSTLVPEKFTNQELGVKWAWTEKMELSMAVYRLLRNNMEVVLGPTTSSLADGQETRGAELSLVGKMGAWQWTGGYTYQDAQITQDLISSTGTILGNTRVEQTPRHAFALWGRYDFNQAWGVGLGVVSRSSMYALTPTTTASTELAGYTRLDAALFWNPEPKFSVQLNIENITNKDYISSAHNNNNLLPGSPISGRLTAQYNF